MGGPSRVTVHETGMVCKLLLQQQGACALYPRIQSVLTDPSASARSFW